MPRANVPRLDEEEMLPKVRALIGKVVKKNLVEGLLFSGGLDTSVIAVEASKHRKITAITICFKQGEAKDLTYAKKLTDFLKLNHIIHFFDVKELFESLNDVISILKTFDPMEVRNSVPVYIGLKLAKEKNLDGVMTGDGLDELFLGYPWLFNLTEDELKKRLLRMWKEMRFSSIPLGEVLKINVKTPFLDPEFAEFAKKVDIKHKLNIKDGKKYGKWLIRRAYEGIIPEEILWREKIPLEIGTGTTVLPKFFEREISDNYYEERRQFYLTHDNVKLTSKEQLFYYEIFRKNCGKPADVFKTPRGKQCPYCKAFLERETSFCRVCGAYPI